MLTDIQLSDFLTVPPNTNFELLALGKKESSSSSEFSLDLQLLVWSIHTCTNTQFGDVRTTLSDSLIYNIYSQLKSRHWLHLNMHTSLLSEKQYVKKSVQTIHKRWPTTFGNILKHTSNKLYYPIMPWERICEEQWSNTTDAVGHKTVMTNLVSRLVHSDTSKHHQFREYETSAIAFAFQITSFKLPIYTLNLQILILQD